MRPSKRILNLMVDSDSSPARPWPSLTPEVLLSRRRDALRKTLETTRKAATRGGLEKVADDAVAAISSRIRGRPEKVPKGHLAIRVVGVERRIVKSKKRVKKEDSETDSFDPKRQTSDRVPLGGLKVQLRYAEETLVEATTDAGGLALFAPQKTRGPLIVEVLAPGGEILASLTELMIDRVGAAQILEVSYAPELEAPFNRGRALLVSERCARQRAEEIKEKLRSALDTQEKLLVKALEALEKNRGPRSKGGK